MQKNILFGYQNDEGFTGILELKWMNEWMRYDFLNLISMFSFQLASLIKHKNSDSEEEEEE